MHTQFGWNENQFQSIAWQASERAMGMMSSAMNIRISKFVTKTLPVGHIMERRESWKESFCPRCGCDEETPQHVIQCNDKDARTIVKKSLAKFEKILCRLHTEKTLQLQLLKHVSEWITIGEIQLSASSLIPFQKQYHLGWTHFMEGRIHESFQTYMDSYYKKIGNKKTGEIWVSVVIQSIWTHIFNPMWEHRNKAVHAKEIKGKLSREVLNLNYTVRDLYQKAQDTQLLFQDRHLLEEKLSQLLKSPTGRKRGWISSMQIALRECQKTIDAENLQMRNAMRRFCETGTCLNTPLTSCSYCPPHQNRKYRVSQRSSQARRMKSLLQISQKRHRSENINAEQSRVRKKIKRNPYRKKPSMYMHRKRKFQTLPTIQERWEMEEHVKKKAI